MKQGFASKVFSNGQIQRMRSCEGNLSKVCSLQALMLAPFGSSFGISSILRITMGTNVFSPVAPRHVGQTTPRSSVKVPDCLVALYFPIVYLSFYADLSLCSHLYILMFLSLSLSLSLPLSSLSLTSPFWCCRLYVMMYLQWSECKHQHEHQGSKK